MSINTTQGHISFFFGGRVTYWLILSLQLNEIFMPFPQMVLGYHCLFVLYFCSLVFELVEFHPFLYHPVFWAPSFSSVSALHCTYFPSQHHDLQMWWPRIWYFYPCCCIDDILCSITGHLFLGWQSPSNHYLRVTPLVADSPKYPSMWFPSF